ncbi:MAG: transcriptional repressor NrdR [Victivallales bacterium]|nr:transcriptional repressor NrdR [Victivallales bacterium]
MIDTRVMNNGETIRRRRQCLNCNFRFTTHETIIPVNITTIIKRDGRREEFNPNKLREGIRMACWKRNISTEILDRIVGDISIRLTLLPQDEIRTDVIGEMVMDALKKVDEVAYVRFASVYRHFKDADAFVQEITRELHTDDLVEAVPPSPADPSK